MKREPLIVKVPTVLQMQMRARWGALTRAQREFLGWAAEYTPPTERDKVHWETWGIGATGSRLAMAKRLERAGLLEYVCMGVDVNDHNDTERPIYAITALGRAVLQSGTGADS